MRVTLALVRQREQMKEDQEFEASLRFVVWGWNEKLRNYTNEKRKKENLRQQQSKLNFTSKSHLH